MFLVWLIHSKLQRSRRNKLFFKPLPPGWIQILEDNVPLYSLLPENLQDELHGRINIFLDEKEFIGCRGLQMSDEIRITISGNACILLLKRDKRCFPRFTSILVHPDTYVTKQVTYDGLVEVHDDSIRSGESWHRGPVVLSWADVIHGSLNSDDGHNVVLHEFAHKLDEENEIMNGLPVLRDSSHYADWAKVLSKEYDSLLIRVEHRTNSVIDAYGAVSPAEFFAVATESFFEKPLQMKQKLPELYEQFKIFYNMDPAEWRNKSRA
ncbi:MAG: protein mtfA [Gammaproteobacteria bacterium]|nr:MAG: protein mtfA [Gammaproteobacteria bacterium]